MATLKQIEANRKNAKAPNTGRPAGSFAVHTIDAIEGRKLAIKFVGERLLPLLEAQYMKAIEGDTMAFNALIDRSWGKAVQGMEISGKDGNPLIFLPLELIQKHNLPVKDEPILLETIDTNIKDSQ